MDIMPFYLVFLQSLPETAILVSLGLVLIGVKPRLLQVLIVALVTALASYFIRALPLPPGINIFLQLPIMVLLVTYLLSIPLTFALLASFLGLIFVTLAEMVFNTIITTITGITLQDAVANSIWRVLFPIPEFIFLTVSIIVLTRLRNSFFNLTDLNQMEQVNKHEKR